MVLMIYGGLCLAKDPIPNPNLAKELIRTHAFSVSCDQGKSCWRTLTHDALVGGAVAIEQAE